MVADPSLQLISTRFGLTVRITLACVALVVLASIDASAVSAQNDAAVYYVPRPLVVVARRDLRFGTVLRGIPSTVLTSDVRYSGLFEINGAKHQSVRVELLLPQSMTSDDGHELPLSFGPGDGAAATDMGRFHGVAFDPNQPMIATLGANGKLYVRLGGTALPIPGQPAGTYRATILLTVFDLGS
jgi:hypothetical protein